MAQSTPGTIYAAALITEPGKAYIRARAGEIWSESEYLGMIFQQWLDQGAPIVNPLEKRLEIQSVPKECKITVQQLQEHHKANRPRQKRARPTPVLTPLAAMPLRKPKFSPAISRGEAPQADP